MDDVFHSSLPDMSHPALTERLDADGQSITIQISNIRQFEDYGPHVDVIHLWALRADGQPIVLRDIWPGAPGEAAFHCWSFLCEQLSAAATLVYGLRPRDDGGPNPRLGCWGPRPDLARPDADDSATAVVIGVAVDTSDALREPNEGLLVVTLRSALVVA